jgi:hypothetical protein
MSTTPEGQRAAMLAATEQHAAAAKHQAEILVTRTQTLARNGVDLRNPERLRDFANDQVVEAIQGAKVVGCGCAGNAGPAAMSLIAELARRLAEATR